MQKIHPLQEKAFPLLRSLYLDENLGVTKAMHAALANYYPPLDEILGTLNRYKKHERVTRFVAENLEFIESANHEIEAQKQQKQVEPFQTEEDNLALSWLSERWSKPVDLLKSKSTREIEEALSNSLSELCSGPVSIVIKNISYNRKALDNTVAIELSVEAVRFER
ncbi:hypothetical protein [Methylomonas sp. 11b]|uniref:hypothetical protein n=1 Tax=Methylomonas sp. 11b TaxID=1168169 RepID=UPI00047B46B2|nr:hypothetical protein [Methylomonas sp. 11b]